MIVGRLRGHSRPTPKPIFTRDRQKREIHVGSSSSDLESSGTCSRKRLRPPGPISRDHSASGWISHIGPKLRGWTPFWSRPLGREQEISTVEQLFCYCCIAQHSTLKTRDQILERSKNRIAPSGTIFRFPGIYLAERVGAPAMYRAAGSDGSSQVRVLVSDIT